MSPRLVDPIAALAEERAARGEPSSAEIVTAALRPPVATLGAIKKQAEGSTSLTPALSLEERCKADFRVFLTVIWRHLLGCDPNPIQLDMAWWLQHGPDRAIIMAFRGFAKSWITGAYALWRLYCDADEKILVVSGSLARAVATTNWCLQLIMTVPLLRHMQPTTSNRQSGQMFDVGNCVPAQSASFMASGISGQLPGWRASLIIPDDVETQTNSLTVGGREKTRDAVKEFESIIVPGGAIKFLGTPHDIDSLYLHQLRLKNEDKSPVYACRIWCALFPTEEEIKSYGTWLAPYITSELRKLGPGAVGHSTMPMRFTDADLAKRRAAMGKSEFLLQFMIDLKGSLVDKYPLKLRDLIVMKLDDKTGPEEVTWGNTNIQRDLPVMGFDGDFYYGPSFVGPKFSPYNRVMGYVDSSGRGSNETAWQIGGELFGRVFWLKQGASKDGFGPTTLQAIAKDCVRFRVQVLRVESNFGDGMFLALLQPVLAEEWRKANEAAAKAARESGKPKPDEGGTTLEEITSGKAMKEARMLSVLEPVTQQHRLVVNASVIEQDYASVNQMDGEETRHRYAWAYQYSHLMKEPDCLVEDDRVESLAGLLAGFADVLGVNPLGMAARAREEREDDELEKLFADSEEAVGLGSTAQKDNRVAAARPAKR